MKLQNKLGAVNAYKVALTKTTDPTLTPKMKMVFYVVKTPTIRSANVDAYLHAF